MILKKVKKIASLLTLSAITALNAIGTAVTPMTYVSAGQQLGQTDFENGVGLPWHVCESAPGEMEFDISNGVYTITIVNPGGASKGGEDRWDCQFRHRGLTLQSGQTYNVSFDITASNNCTYYTKIGDMGEPYAEDWHGEPDSSQHESFWDVKPLTANQTQHVEGTFTANRTADVEWAFHIGGDSVPEGTVFTFDNMSLECTTSSENDYAAPEEWIRSDILTNQLGYFTKMNKKATLLSDSSSPVKFELKDSGGKSVFSGESEPGGLDADSGDNVHELDFSDFDKEGTYYLEAENGAKSREFAIGNGELYSYMLYDSLNYFYQNRSGIEIESQYITSGDAASLARAAGHTSDNATIEQTWGYSGSSGTQDVTGGWYDAGDHGKYVVNGGISLWTMQNQYEMALKNGSESAYADGTMSIPENSNGYPDLLDEARYEMEWMFKMMVRDGDYKDMVYHKVHDIKWTALALAPADDPEERIIKPPTTAATLNMAACAAQAARLWKDIDPAFSEQCLANAKAAYEAAKKHPDMYAPLDESIGGGPYGDDDASDEFYWAACELYLATEDGAYKGDMEGSEYYAKIDTKLSGGEDVDSSGSFNWGHTAALGSMSLAVNADKLDGGAKDKLTAAFTGAAEYYDELIDNQGYGQPYEPGTVSYIIDRKGYIWGSNSFIVNNGMIMAYAYELTGEDDYIEGVVSAMDYILGRNPMDYSYVTGYGTHAVANPHHRWWSGQTNADFPFAPNGVLVGGPNSGMQDPWVRGSGWKPGEIAPAKCYMDNVEAWSVNECTINWNTPLAWISSYLADKNGGIEVVHGSSGSGANNTDKSDGQNPAAGNGEQNEYKTVDSKNDSSSKKNSVAGSRGGWGLVPFMAAAVAAAIIIEIVVFIVKRSSKSK
ncbi:MAG: glycoside hydrolase family 9 protein [Clostridium sp.]|nr:glycoside hydrolase family 9 protein [Clostridium sp.]MCM1548257.1 glycoside hydrolase family 9 protein [Ruminococcus sp.]